MREVARRAGKELVIEDMSFDSVITAVVSGKADVAASGITVTPERRKQVDFSIPYVEAAQVIIVPKGSSIRSRDDIRGRKIGVQHGATGDIYVTRNIQQPERFPNGALAVAALAAGKVDLVVIDRDPARMYLANHDELEILPEPLTSKRTPLPYARETRNFSSTSTRSLPTCRRPGSWKRYGPNTPPCRSGPPVHPAPMPQAPAGWKASGWT